MLLQTLGKRETDKQRHEPCNKTKKLISAVAVINTKTILKKFHGTNVESPNVQDSSPTNGL